MVRDRFPGDPLHAPRPATPPDHAWGRAVANRTVLVWLAQLRDLVSGANLLSWFALGILAAAPVAVLVPVVGMTLGFLVTLVGLLAALSAHAVAEDRRDGAAIVRVAAAYLLAALGAAGAGLWWMTVILVAGGVTAAVQAHRWARAHPRESTPSVSS